MAPKKNEFTADLDEQLTELAALSHASHGLGWLFEQGRQKARSAIDSFERSGRERPETGILGLSTRLAVRDDADPGAFVVRFPYGGHFAQDEHVLRLAEELEKRTRRQILCSAFEVTETFLKHVGAKAFFHSRTGHYGDRETLKFAKKRFHRFRTERASASSQEGTPEYFRDYVTWLCKGGCDKLLVEFGNGLAFFNGDTLRKAMLERATDRFRGISFLRHTSIHNDGRYRKEELSKARCEYRQLVEEMTESSLLTGADTLLPTKKHSAPRSSKTSPA